MLKIDFINVGYGDSILVREYTGSELTFSMLVDTGDWDMQGHYEENRWRIRSADFLKCEGLDAIDLLIITHLHKDHVGGILHLVQHIKVHEFWAAYIPPQETRVFPERNTMLPEAESLACALELYMQAVSLMREKGTRIRRIGEMETSFTEHLKGIFLYGWNGKEHEHDAIVDRFYSYGVEDGTEAALLSLDRYINNISLVLLLTYEQQHILLAGDAYLSFWKGRQVPQCDLLKLAHHGHPDAIDTCLAERFAPRFVVVSVSDNRLDDCPSAKAASAFDVLPHPPIFFCTDGARIPGYCAGARHHSVSFEVMDGQLLSTVSYSRQRLHR